MVLQPRAATLIIALILMFGGMIYPMYALAVAHANDFAAPDDFVKIAGGLLLLYGGGTMVGPILAALAMEGMSPEGLFAFCALVHLALALYVIFRMGRRAAPDLATREAFQPMLAPKSVTPESALLDPRAEPGSEAGTASEEPVPVDNAMQSD